MADGSTSEAVTTVARSKKKFQWRVLLRAIHRDAGYTAVGLTLIYALSGLAVNHVADWDPNFKNATRETMITVPLPADDDELARVVGAELGARETPKEIYRNGDEVEILYDHRTLHVNTATGHVLDQEQKPRFLLRVANWLHLNRGKKAWTYVADTYAAALLFLATSGMFMLKGRQGMFGRGAFFVAIGVAIPVAYVVLAGG
jgi:hypothetical protein